MPMTLTLLVDAATTTGMGHWVRSSTLAAEMERRGWVVRVVHRPDVSNAASDDARARGWPTTVSEWTPTALSPDCTGTVLLIDSYRIDAAGIAALGYIATGVVVVDDLADRGPIHADLVVNQNLGADSRRYQVSPQTDLLLGPKFALLRRQFLNARMTGLNRIRGVVSVQEVLVLMGGTDATGVLPSVVQACLLGLPEVRVRAIAPPHATDGLQHLLCDRLSLVDPTPDIADEMVRADLIVSAGGTSVWELCAAARPFGVVVVADNQIKATALLEHAGATRVLGSHPIDTGATARSIADLASDGRVLAEQARTAAGIVDGRGCSRVADRIDHLFRRRTS